MSRTTDVLDLLAALGDTEERVAASLRAMGVTGQRGEPCACPLFYYLRDAGIPVQRVTRKSVHVDGVDGPIRLLDAVEDFLDAFDVDNAYPALVEPEEVAS